MSYPNPADEPRLTDEIYITGTGQTIANVHTVTGDCAYGCVIHFPSYHHMREWPTNWRDGGMFDIKPAHMERICPHGVGHPDPDSAVYLRRLGEDIMVHGCDGCCEGAYIRLEEYAD